MKQADAPRLAACTAASRPPTGSGLEDEMESAKKELVTLVVLAILIGAVLAA